MKQEIIQCIKDLVGHEFLYFDTAIEVKLTPHSLPFNAWAACVSHKDELFVMDSDEQWHELEETDNNYEIVLSTLYQRVTTIYKQVKTA